jgi:hypothetical protein
MIESGREKGPYKDLLVADQHRSVLTMDVDCSSSKEVQWHPVITKRLPHPDRNRYSFLIERSVFLTPREQYIEVSVLLKRAPRRSGRVDTYSDEDGTVLRCQ